MIKKIINILGVFILTLFSFYYTNKMVELSKNKDIIMKEIKSNKKNYEVDYVNALIDDYYIIPGLVGIKVDVDKSYYKMKELGSYNDNLYIFINEYPKISINNIYDKFIINGNSKIRNVSIIFKLTNTNNVNEILQILKDNNVTANFFIDGKVFSNNINILKNIVENNNFLGNLGYDNEYKKTSIKFTNSLINKFSSYNNNYCYVENDDKEVLDICSNLNMYTVKSKILSNVNPYLDLKERLVNGGIYTFDTNDYTIKTLPVIIKYIKQKGYDIVNINELLNESALDKE